MSEIAMSEDWNSVTDRQQPGVESKHDRPTTLSAAGVTVSYQSITGTRVEAVDNVSFDIREGEFVSIIGPSGCGKSTLLRALGGLTQTSGGSVMLHDEQVTKPQPEKIGFVFQDYTLFPWRSVLANTVMGLQFRGVKRREREERAWHYLDLVGLGWCADSYPAELSGGMQQRVAIARALTCDPAVLLMDEPFGALDEQTRMLLGSELASIVEKANKTVILVTHSLAEAVFLSDRVFVMSARPGHIKEIIDVPAPQPRTEDFLMTPMFDDIRSQVFASLIEEVHLQAKINEESRRAKQ